MEDSRGGGLGGGGERRRGVLWTWVASTRSAPARSAPFTVEDDDDEVPDSRSAGSPWYCDSSVSSCAGKFPILLLVTGGRLRVGLTCLSRIGDLAESGMPGECDDIDVGVDVRLNAPGDSERRVDEPLLCAKLGVGGGKFCVDMACGVDCGW